MTKKTLFERFIKKNLHIPDFFCIFTPVFVRMHSKGARTYTQEQINYDERILFIDRSAGSRSKCRNPLLQNMFRFIGFGEKAGSGADIIAKGWEENHWARPTIKDSYFPSEETEPYYPRENNGRKT